MSMPSVFAGQTVEVGWFGDGCGNAGPMPIQDVKGKIALVSRDNATDFPHSHCNYAKKAIAAEVAGAVGLVIMSDKNVPLIDANCEGVDCDVPLVIPITMTTYSVGNNILSRLMQNRSTILSVGYLFH